MSDGLFKTQLRRLMPRAVRPHRILSGRLRGRWIVTSWHDYPAAILGRTERALLDWFEGHVKPGQTWLDVGAHYGYTAIALSLPVAYHCLLAYGFRDYDRRTVVHSIAGCFV